MFQTGVSCARSENCAEILRLWTLAAGMADIWNDADTLTQIHAFLYTANDCTAAFHNNVALPGFRAWTILCLSCTRLAVRRAFDTRSGMARVSDSSAYLLVRPQYGTHQVRDIFKIRQGSMLVLSMARKVSMD